MKSRSSKRIVAKALAVGAAVLAIALTGAGTATADDGLPPHAAPSPFCADDGYGDYYIHSMMPYMEVRPETLGVINGDGTGTNAYDEWVYYRLWVGWRGSDGNVQYAPSSWLASLNGYPSTQGYSAWMQNPDGSWRYLQAGSPDEMVRLIVSGVQVQRYRTYWVWGEYKWGAFGNYSSLDHFEYAGTFSCGT